MANNVALMRSANIGFVERVISGVVGGISLSIGVRRRNLWVGLLGAELVRRALLGRSFLYGHFDIDTRRARSFGTSYEDGRCRIRRSVTINRPRDELYELGRDPLNFKKFALYLKDVQVLDQNRYRWTFEIPGGTSFEWTTEMVEFPKERITWRALPGSATHPEITLLFFEAPGSRGTEIHGELLYTIPGGVISRGIARILHRAPDELFHANLRRFKKLAETGEIISTQGQTSGRLAA